MAKIVFIQSKAFWYRYVMNIVFSFQTMSLKLGCGIKNDREMCFTGAADKHLLFRNLFMQRVLFIPFKVALSF